MVLGLNPEIAHVKACETKKRKDRDGTMRVGVWLVHGVACVRCGRDVLALALALALATWYVHT